MKLKPNALQNNVINHNINLYPNLNGAPNNDIFIKNTNSPKEVSFGSSYISDVQLENDYYKKYAAEVQKKWDEVWKWTSKRPRYQQYFEKLNIEKPKLVFVTKHDYPNYSSDDEELSYDKGAPTRYNWINNTILIDTDYCPNIILASKGKMALTPHAVADDFIFNNNEPDPESDRVSPFDFEDLEKRSLDFAISDGSDADTNYFSILTPKEAAELMPAFLAHEAEHTVAMHVILNTAGINIQKFRDAFNNLRDADMLPPHTTEHWTQTYPYQYRKQLSAMAFDKEDFWKVRDDSGNSLKRIKHNELLNAFFTNADDVQNLLELDARYASISYLDNQRFSGFNDVAQEKLNMSLDFQERAIRGDIENRLLWTGLTRAAKKVQGKKPASTVQKKGGNKNTKTNGAKKKK